MEWDKLCAPLQGTAGDPLPIWRGALLKQVHCWTVLPGTADHWQRWAAAQDDTLQGGRSLQSATQRGSASSTLCKAGHLLVSSAWVADLSRGDMPLGMGRGGGMGASRTGVLATSSHAAGVSSAGSADCQSHVHSDHRHDLHGPAEA